MNSDSTCSSNLNTVKTCYTTGQDDFSPTTSEMKHSDQNSQEIEMLRRILQQSDKWTKEHIRACLSENLLVWLRLYPRRVEDCDCEDEEYLVQTLEYIFQASGHCTVLECDSTDDLMRRLNASLNGLLIDTLRSRSKRIDVSRP